MKAGLSSLALFCALLLSDTVSSAVISQRDVPESLHIKDAPSGYNEEPSDAAEAHYHKRGYGQSSSKPNIYGPPKSAYGSSSQSNPYGGAGAPQPASNPYAAYGSSSQSNPYGSAGAPQPASNPYAAYGSSSQSNPYGSASASHPASNSYGAYGSNTGAVYAASNPYGSASHSGPVIPPVSPDYTPVIPPVYPGSDYSPSPAGQPGTQAYGGHGSTQYGQSGSAAPGNSPHANWAEAYNKYNPNIKAPKPVTAAKPPLLQPTGKAKKQK